MEAAAVKFVNQFSPGGGITLDLPSFGGIFQNGLLSAVGAVMTYVFAFLVVVWVGISIFAALRIVSSAGETDRIESAVTSIRNIWVGISSFLVFFVILSLAGVIFGFGSVLDWSTNLAQCGPTGGSKFYFQLLEEDEYKSLTESTDNIFIGCCDFGEGKEWKVLDSNSLSLGGAISLSENCSMYKFIKQ